MKHRLTGKLETIPENYFAIVMSSSKKTINAQLFGGGGAPVDKGVTGRVEADKLRPGLHQELNALWLPPRN